MDETVLRKIPPHHREAERSVVGAMLLDRAAAIQAIDSLMPEDFYLKECAYVFNAVKAVVEENAIVDPTTVSNKLIEMNAPAEIASGDYLRNLVMWASTSAVIGQHIDIVKEKSILRQVISVNSDIENKCYSDSGGADEILDEAERRIRKIASTRSAGDLVPIRRVVKDTVERIGKAAKAGSAVTGVATGFTELDYKMAGLQPSNLILVGARPSMGKTAFILNIAKHICINDKKTAIIFSLEMSKEDLMNRLLSMESHVNAERLRNGSVTPTDWEGIIEAASTLGESGMLIDDTPNITVAELRSKCRKYKTDHPDLAVVFIDYLQLMSGSGKYNSPVYEVGEISKSLKGLARELEIPIVTLSQLSRDTAKRENKRPVLSDLRDSGSIEQDADVVMFLHREDYYDSTTEKKNITEVIIAKQRNGPIGTVELVWLPEQTRFANKERS